MFDQRAPQLASSYTNLVEKAKDTTLEVSKEIAKLIEALSKLILEKLNEKKELDKVEIQVGTDTYVLEQDPECPGAWKWSRVDLTNENTTNSSQRKSGLSEFQAQIITTRLVEDVPDFDAESEHAVENEPALKITAYTESEEGIVLYEQSSEGKCITNLVTENLTTDEIIEVAKEPLVKLLPPSSEIVKNAEENANFNPALQNSTELESKVNPPETIATAENIDATEQSAITNDGLSQLLSPSTKQETTEPSKTNVASHNSSDNIQSLSSEGFVGFLDDIDISNPPEFDSPPDEDIYAANAVQIAVLVSTENSATSEPKAESVIPDTEFTNLSASLNEQTYTSENTEQTASALEEPNLAESDTVNAANSKNLPLLQPATNKSIPQQDTENTTNEQKSKSRRNQFLDDTNASTENEEPTTNTKKPAASYTYSEVLQSDDVEPRAQQWARQVELPVYEMKNRQLEKQRLNTENQQIATAATELLKKYGNIEADGTRIYRSDAFIIRKDGFDISIHHRRDETKGFENPLFEFKLDKNGSPKNIKQSEAMLPIERQEFLIVAERLEEKHSLPSLQSEDIRSVANTLGSLAPAGTLKTLETFKQTELLGTLNTILQQAKTDELTVGEFTIHRTRNLENNRASLSLYKTTQGLGTQELVRFNLQKTDAGITKEVAKMNISDYDINQVKFIAQNIYKLDLERIFDNSIQPRGLTHKKLSREIGSVDLEAPTFTSQSVAGVSPVVGSGVRGNRAGQFLGDNASPSPSAASSSQQPKEVESVGDIPVRIHPYIAEEWQNMVKKGGSQWSGAMNQGNEEIAQAIKQNNGKVAIANQREMYFKIMTNKIASASAKGETTMEFVELKEIMKDLVAWRSLEINSRFTPTTTINSPERTASPSAAAPKVKLSNLEV